MYWNALKQVEIEMTIKHGDDPLSPTYDFEVELAFSMVTLWERTSALYDVKKKRLIRNVA